MHIVFTQPILRIPRPQLLGQFHSGVMTYRIPRQRNTMSKETVTIARQVNEGQPDVRFGHYGLHSFESIIFKITLIKFDRFDA